MESKKCIFRLTVFVFIFTALALNFINTPFAYAKGPVVLRAVHSYLHR